MANEQEFFDPSRLYVLGFRDPKLIKFPDMRLNAKGKIGLPKYEND